MRILALDWGRVRIGAAVSDETEKIAFALDKFFEMQKGIEDLIRFVSEKGIERIIVGNPISLLGESGESSRQASEFVEKLGKKIDIPIEMLDERFSSVAAEKVLTSQGMKQKEQRLIKDNIAAQIMLQQYLDTKSKNE